MTAQNTAPATRAPATAGPARAARRAALAAAATAGLALTGLLACGASANAAVPLNCQAVPSACGYPDATNTGVPAGTALQVVGSQVSSGPGWAYDAAEGTVYVTGNGAVLSGLSITGLVDISASNVTLDDDQITSGGTYAIELRDTANVTIENSAIGGENATTGRVGYAIDDVYSDSTGTVVKDDNLSDWRVGIALTSGLITGNYIHAPGYQSGDHTDGIYDNQGTQQLTISDNTILNSLSQTCDIILESSATGPVSNLDVTGNLLAGGDYNIYAGGNDTTNIVIQDNRFGQQYYPTSGQYGTASDYSPAGSGNSWTGNIWDSTAATVPAP
jgi:hypothetical protein